ncbi:MAG: hypothetical protein M1113_05280 [Candidatus Thermoplasmatota archaeon]|nr:hypothetical protein [Candidatus Thermoplasmatota archaeon]
MSIELIVLKIAHEIYNFINSILGFPWISAVIPSTYIPYLAPISLIIAGSLTERHYVGRIPIFTNTIALNVLFYYSQSNFSYFGTLFLSVFEWYANIGLIMGLIAVMSYASKGKRSKTYYTIAWAYSSIVVGLLIAIFYAYPYLS